MIESTTAPASIHSSPQQSKTKKRINRSRRQWKLLLDDFHRSGLTKVAFCQQYGVATSSLNRWQRMLEGQPESGNFVDVTEALSAVPAALSSTQEGGDAWQVELALGNNIVLRIRTA
jgi:hypothetical protein